MKNQIVKNVEAKTTTNKAADVTARTNDTHLSILQSFLSNDTYAGGYTNYNNSDAVYYLESAGVTIACSGRRVCILKKELEGVETLFENVSYKEHKGNLVRNYNDTLLSYLDNSSIYSRHYSLAALENIYKSAKELFNSNALKFTKANKEKVVLNFGLDAPMTFTTFELILKSLQKLGSTGLQLEILYVTNKPVHGYEPSKLFRLTFDDYIIILHGSVDSYKTKCKITLDGPSHVQVWHTTSVGHGFARRLSTNEHTICSVLRTDVVTQFDDLLFKTGLSIDETLIALIELEYEGIVTQLPGKHYKTTRDVA